MKRSVVVVLVAACAGTPSPKLPAERLGRVERLQIGTLQAFALEDGHLVLPNDGQLFAVGLPPSETAELLAAAGLPRDKIELDVQCLLVKAGDRVLLFDAGAGEQLGAEGGRLPQSLALANIAPAAVTDIFISHVHGDHVGGLVTKAGALAFPTATIHMSTPEWAAFRASTEDDSKRMVATIAAKVSPFEPGARVLPAVRAVATPGHTPGHSSYEIGSGADTLVYTGDLAHHSVISLQRRAWSLQVDSDHAAADAMREQILAQLAADHVRVFVAHFPFPGVGHVGVAGQGFVWKP